jgi:hypothetical protein
MIEICVSGPAYGPKNRARTLEQTAAGARHV